MLSDVYRLVAALIALGILGVTPSAAASLIKDYVPSAKMVGEGRLSVFMMDVYDARLYAPSGKFDFEKPLALSLTYLRDISAQKITDRSIEEIRNQGSKDEVKLADWHAQMMKFMPNVSEGTQISGIKTKSDSTIFLKDGQIIGKISDPEFTMAFFNIWLGDQTSAPNLRRKLMGLAKH